MANASTQRSLGVLGEKRGCRGLMAQGCGAHARTHSHAGVARSHTKGSEGGGENKELPSSLQKFSKQINCNRKRFADTKWWRWPGVLWRHCSAAGGRRRASLLVFAEKKHFSSSGPSAVEPEPIQLLWGAFRVVVVLLKEVVSTHSLRFSLSQWSNSVWSSQRQLTSRLFGLSWCNKI